jgi:ribosomal protein S18 acetylase RimI-like enzyme
MSYHIRAVEQTERERLAQFINQQWGDDLMVVHGQSFQPSQLPALVAEVDDEWLGLLTYTIQQNECEVISLDSFCEGQGIGTALMQAVYNLAREAACSRVFLITTNDNLHAIRFYQKRGMYLSALYPNAVAQARAIKPTIPLLGYDDIPIRDEIELSFDL